MTVNGYKKRFLGMLPLFYDEMERLNLFYMSMEKVMGFSRSDAVLNGELEVPQQKEEELDEVLARLQRYEPIQYITEKSCFFGYDFKVTPSTLIPRPETEELVAWVLDEMRMQPKKEWRILDIGTGSGCIPITLKKEFPLAMITGIDFSEQALKIAEENAFNLKASVSFLQQDILNVPHLPEYDIIISNPPYVRNLEKTEMHENVMNYEPHAALFVDDADPLIFYKKICGLANKSLSEEGMLFFEINQYLGAETEALAGGYFNKIELRKDFMANDRMMKASDQIKSC